ncbi:uncharacterized protein A4U43_C04F14340 [Asparagus officinalis]|uniref:Protein SAMBA n=1 Tax=Asparagus officinalis TaxID=4686 RepID=A0A5P1F2M0_ASPOF|nr:uncharacterized protein LOC109837279 [Asparagus officinalis]XP_020261038.1 uncharacterized protein LOC109837279 [Asparagus officinalis]ONK71973.1 uncharacterized protein A4U43_C04F14340 [Asparagus officinalis]
MSSPARSSASATSAGQGGGGSTNAAFGDDTSPYHFPTDLVSPQERKEEALAVLKSDLMEALQKEVKSLDEDDWMFSGPRSQINLISRPVGMTLAPVHQHNTPLEIGQGTGSQAPLCEIPSQRSYRQERGYL